MQLVEKVHTMTDLYQISSQKYLTFVALKEPALAGQILIASTITFHIKRADNLSMDGRAGMAALKYATSQIRNRVQMQSPVSSFQLQVPQKGARPGKGRGLRPGESLTTELQAKPVTDSVV